jgi:single-strand DNA-binding protein
MNQVFLMGRLTADPELRKTNNENYVCNVVIAVNGTGEDEVDFFPVTVWKGKAEALCKYMHKGNKIVVTGKLKTRSYIDSNNNIKRITEVIASDIYFAESSKQPANNDPIFDPDHRTQEEWKAINDAMANVEDAPF